MPTTTTHSISYPSGSQAPNVPVVMQTMAESVDAAITAAVIHPLGHMGKTDAFQVISALTRNTFSAAQMLKGGVTFDNANDALVVPVAGLYRINFQHYTTGSGSGTQIGAIYVNSTQIGISARAYKQADEDMQSHGSGFYQLAVNDLVSLHSQHAGTVSSWGTNGWNGTYVEIEYIMP